MKQCLLGMATILFCHCTIAQARYTIVIDEIMADPSPTIGLPNTEWIELKNTSAIPVDLQNWRIADASGQSGPLPAFILAPGGFVLLCGSSAVAALSQWGTAIAVSSFPSLDNEGELLMLKAANGNIIHAVNYSADWYDNELKKEGGWSLEMIDTHSPCAGTNWKASKDLKGGTPGTINSVNAINNDDTAPQLINSYSLNDSTIILVFDEPVDSQAAATTSNYSISHGLNCKNVITLLPLFDRVQVTVDLPMDSTIIYSIQATGIPDCKGNMMMNDSIRTGLPVAARKGDIVINEILFDPRPNAFDYAEFYNNGAKIIDAATLSVANRNASAVISSIKPVCLTPRYLFPGDYLVITENISSLALNYLVKNPAAVVSMGSLPSFPDQSGDVVLLNFQGELTDEVVYTDDWHFKLLNNVQGVSLERIDPAGPSNDPANWHSAASTAGYGTPGYKNSQFKNNTKIAAGITIAPAIFSPDNDGRDDIASIQYHVDEPGYVATILVFDAAGRVVKTLVRNALLGLAGSWNWDGLGDQSQPLPVGPYIILTEIFNLQGRKQSFKNGIVLARKLN